MTPVKQRIADGFLQCLRPFLEFFSVWCVSGDITLLHTIGTHLAPFVMVSAKPYLCDVLKLSVLCDVSAD